MPIVRPRLPRRRQPLAELAREPRAGPPPARRGRRCPRRTSLVRARLRRADRSPPASRRGTTRARFSSRAVARAEARGELRLVGRAGAAPIVASPSSAQALGRLRADARQPARRVAGEALARLLAPHRDEPLRLAEVAADLRDQAVRPDADRERDARSAPAPRRPARAARAAASRRRSGRRRPRRGRAAAARRAARGRAPTPRATSRGRPSKSGGITIACGHRRRACEAGIAEPTPNLRAS